MDRRRVWEGCQNALEWIALSPFIVCCIGTVCIYNLCQGHWRHPELCGTGRTQERDRKAQAAKDELLEKNAPRPLPETRKRALTAPLPVAEAVSCSSVEFANAGEWLEKGKSARQQRTFEQAESPLFTKFPAEIRRLIYIELFSGDGPTVHIVRKYRRLGHLRCINDCTSRPLRLEGSCWNIMYTPGEWVPSPTKPQTDGGMIPLLLACRKTYSEAIDLLYSSNTFSVLNLDGLIHLSATILPQRLDVIRKLHLTCHPWSAIQSQHFLVVEWNKVCEVMARMRGLQELRIEMNAEGLRRTGNTTNQAEERWLLEPLMKVTRVRDFQVTLWLGSFGDQGNEMVEGAPFRLIRRRDAVLWPLAQ